MHSPAVTRTVLRLLAGIIWTVVGLVLCAMAVYWLVNIHNHWFELLAAGIIAGVVVYRFGFLRLVQKNKARIHAQTETKDKICLFAFQSWRSYIIIIVMMALGAFLRHLPISREYLVPVYLTIGIGLFLASLHYYSSPQ